MPADTHLPTRASLLERLKDLGDHTSWDEFHRTYRELIYSVARRAALNEMEADEVVQDTVICVAKKMPGFTYDPAKDTFKGWLLTLTRWRILDQFEKRNQVVSQSLLTSAPTNEEAGTRTATVERVADPASFDLKVLWDEEWGKHLLQAALARIKRQVHPQHYEIYHLHVILGQPVRDVSRALGVNVAQVHLAKFRVGQLLKKEIRRLPRVG